MGAIDYGPSRAHVMQPDGDQFERVFATMTQFARKRGFLTDRGSEFVDQGRGGGQYTVGRGEVLPRQREQIQAVMVSAEENDQFCLTRCPSCTLPGLGVDLAAPFVVDVRAEHADRARPIDLVVSGDVAALQVRLEQAPERLLISGIARASQRRHPKGRASIIFKHLRAARRCTRVVEQYSCVKRFDQLVDHLLRESMAIALVERRAHRRNGMAPIKVGEHGGQRLRDEELLVGQLLGIAQQDVGLVVMNDRADVELTKFRVHIGADLTITVAG